MLPNEKKFEPLQIRQGIPSGLNFVGRKWYRGNRIQKMSYRGGHQRPVADEKKQSGRRLSPKQGLN